jgi:hypothetical protein
MIHSQYTLFSLGMFTYTYERHDIIQIALKRLPEGFVNDPTVGVRSFLADRFI